MAMAQRSTVVGVFEDHAKANQAVEALRQAGFREDQIGVVGRYGESATGATGTATADTDESNSMWEEGAITGALTGAGLGALVGLGILAGIIPVVGPVIAGGTLSMLLANAAGGAALAGLTGALVGAGIPEDEATYYEGEVRGGRTVVTVQCGSRYSDAHTILHQFGAYDMSTAPAATGTTGSAAMTTGTNTGTAARAATAQGGETIRVHEEQLHATKTAVQTGEVRVRKEVHTEHQTIDVPVSREEVVIERHPVSGHSVSGSSIGQGEEIRIPVSEEQVHVTKETVAKEDVTIGKRVVSGTEHVAGEVRKEEVRVEKQGDVDIKRSGNSGNTGKR